MGNNEDKLFLGEVIAYWAKVERNARTLRQDAESKLRELTARECLADIEVL